MDDLLPEFIDETIEGLSSLDNDLVRLELDPSQTGLLDNAFRVMHTIKGTCGFIGLPRLEKIAHAAENLMDKFRSGQMPITEQSMTVLFMSVDRVRYIVTEIQKLSKEPEGDDKDIIALIEAVVNGTQTAPAPIGDMAEEAAIEAAPPAEEVETPAPKPAAKAEPAPAPKPAATATQEKSSEYIRVHMDVLEELVSKASELILTRNQLMQLMPVDDESGVKTPFNHLCRLVSELQDGVMKARMQPISEVTSKFPRLVRDLAQELKKKIAIEISGEETELDRQVLELVRDPLTHMLRNACDHGIEPPEERLATGKTEQGHIRLEARHEGGVVLVVLKDDGRGLDSEKIGRKAVEKGLVTEDRLLQMSRKEVLQFIMAPGFSTAAKVTNVSGRGVGMDVVRANVEKIGGSIDMDSTVGKGSVFTLHIPLTLAIIPALIVRIDGLKYAIPQLNVQEVLALDTPGAPKVETVRDIPVLRLRQHIIPLLCSSMLFSHDREARRNFNPADVSPESLIAVVNAGANQFGIILDQIHGTEEVVIKSISPVLRNTAIFAGNTILGDGQVVMILDPAAIARRFHIDKDKLSQENQMQDDAHPDGEVASMLVFRAGTDIPKTLPLELVSRVQTFNRKDIRHSGQHVFTVYDQQMIPLLAIDGQYIEVQKEEITAVILVDDISGASIGVVIDEIIGVMESTLELSASTARPGILGSIFLENGETADVLDIVHFLSQNNQDWFLKEQHRHQSFAPVSALDMRLSEHLAPAERSTAATAQEAALPEEFIRTEAAPMAFPKGVKRVLVVDDSGFFRNMLYPILRSAGYEVAMSHDPLHAIERHDNGEMFDVILSDIEMPHMTGYEFVEKMRAEGEWKHTPFIAITSHNTVDDVRYGMQKGFDFYIGKFDRGELLRALNSAAQKVTTRKTPVSGGGV